MDATTAGALGVLSFFGIYWFLAWVACGAFSSHVASEKERCGACWFVWGILFGPLALVAVVGLPDNSKPRGIDAVTPKTHVLCPQCGEPVKNEAKICKHCHSKLVPLSQQKVRLSA